MADITPLERVLNFQHLGKAYQEGSGKHLRNPLYQYYVGEPVVEVQTALADAVQDLTEVSEYNEAVRDQSMNTSFGERSIEMVEGDSVEYVVMSEAADPLPMNRRGSPARVVNAVGLDSRKITLQHMFSTVKLSMRALEALREPENWVLQKLGTQETLRQAQDFAIKHTVAKQVYLAKSLADNFVYLNFEGDILESSSGAETTVDMGVPAGHRGQLDFDGSGALITAAWDVAGTDILLHLDRLKSAAEAEAAEEPRHVWLHGDSKAWIRNNTSIRAYYSGITRLDQDLAGDKMELNGYTFHFFSGTYIGTDGARKPFIPRAKAIITPDLGPWFLNAMGKQALPTSTGMAGTPAEILANMVEVFGQYAYGHIDHNPTAVSIYMGDNFQYAFRNPKSMWSPTVDF